MKNSVVKLEDWKFGVAVGILMGAMIALMTIFILLGYMEPQGGLKQIYGPLGFDYSVLGIFLGAIYGFIDGFIFGYVVAWIYNKL